jgi:hypothetical protein
LPAVRLQFAATMAQINVERPDDPYFQLVALEE